MLLAFDFDGVICDGLREYFQVAWRVYSDLWSAPALAPAGLAERFYPLRAVIESGWEMPLLIQALMLGEPEENIFNNWPSVRDGLLTHDPKELGSRVDQTRDQWIAEDPLGWLALHRFYPGVIERLGALAGTPMQIITTKEARFVQQLLAQGGLTWPASQITGKGSGRPKTSTLADLVQGGEEVYFIEDRLQTLQAVTRQPNLNAVHLYLADWGYNTPQERAFARQDRRIKLISLAEFQQWPN